MTARRLGWNTIDITLATSITEAGVMLAAERDENTCRKAFTPTEEHAVYEAVLALEKPKAAERMSDGGKGVKVSHPSPQPQRSKDAAAKAASGSAGRAAGAQRRDGSVVPDDPRERRAPRQRLPGHADAVVVLLVP